MAKFKIGDKVRIKKGTEWYGKGIANPAEITGEIIKIESDSRYTRPYVVNWNLDGSRLYNGSYYFKEELELYEEEFEKIKNVIIDLYAIY